MYLQQCFPGRGFFAYSYGTFRSYGSPADLLCGRIGAFDEAGCVWRFFERGKGWHADCDRDCADADRADGGGRGLRSSGFLEDFGNLLGTVLEPTGIPSALVPLSVVRLFSNSAAVSLLLDLYKEAGCDSFAGRAASIIMSCTETVFYTMTVYFGAVRIKKTRYTLAGALFSSLVGMTVGVLLARLI